MKVLCRNETTGLQDFCAQKWCKYFMFAIYWSIFIGCAGVLMKVTTEILPVVKKVIL